MNRKVSVIIPAYNVEKYIRKCLESLLEQTYQNYEIIIVNDGSTDNTLNILNEYKKKYEFIKIIDIENHGQGYARNIALSKATGDYILFLDSDDFIEKVTLQVAVERIEEDNSDLVLFDWKYYFDNTEKFSYVNTEKFFGKKILENDEVLDLFTIKHYFTVNKLYSKKFLIENNIKYGEGYIYEDNPFWVNVVINAKKVSLVHSPLYNVRINQNSTTKTKLDTDKHYKGFIKAISEMIKITQKKPEHDYYNLYNYIMKKFNFYYKKRVPRRYKAKFLNDFIEVMHNAVEIKEPNVQNILIKLAFKYHIFKNKRKVLFNFIYKTFLIKRFFRREINIFKRGTKKIITKINCYSKKATNQKKENSILFMGFDYRYTGNSRYLFEMFLDKKVENIFFVTEDKTVEDKYRIKPESKDMYKKLYSSKVVIFESWIPSKIAKTEDSIWIQLWHGTPLKRMLFDSEETDIITKNLKHKINKYNDINNWDYLILDNQDIYQYFETSFLIPREKTLAAGYPRVKYLISNKENIELKNKIRKDVGIANDQKIVLYLPTWRDYNYGKEKTMMDFSYFMNMNKLQKELGDNYIVISKNHTYLNNDEANKITNVNIETQELLLIADYLITDYSSVMFDAFAIDLPVIILAKDFEKNEKSRGVYKSIWQDLLPFVTYKEEETANKIKDYQVDSEAYKKVKEKYGYKSDIDLFEFILNIREEGEK